MDVDNNDDDDDTAGSVGFDEFLKTYLQDKRRMLVEHQAEVEVLPKTWLWLVMVGNRVLATKVSVIYKYFTLSKVLIVKITNKHTKMDCLA